jgi:hypothetical protein
MTGLTDRECAGRMPKSVTISPSGEYPWYGRYQDGRRLSEQQHNALISAGADPVNPETITVRRNATDREMWWGIGQYPPYFEFECPVVARLADGRIKVISPSGANKIVLRDGWATRPGKRKVGWY